MNCWDWRKKITATVSVQGSYNFSYSSPDDPSQSYTLNGSQTFEHEAIYTEWTRRELKCIGAPLPTSGNAKTDWVLRGTEVDDFANFDVCKNRTTLAGNLSQKQQMTATSSKPDIYPDQLFWLYFWTVDNNGLWTANRNLLQGIWIYPELENDPYSVARRKTIDGLISSKAIYFYADFYTDDPSPQYYAPELSIPLTWYKDGVSGEKSNPSPNITEEKSVTLNLTFALA